MHSFKVAAITATAFLGFAQCQTIDPSTVPQSLRANWCQSQITSCPLLCLQFPNTTSTTTQANDCDPDTLVYHCVCGNGQSPNASEFSQTIPYFECSEFNNQCVAACASGDSACQSACRDNHPCGAQNPTRVNTTTSSTTSTASSTNSDGTVYNGLGTSSTTPSSDSSHKSGSHSALDLGQSYGLAVVFAGIFAGFALIM